MNPLDAWSPSMRLMVLEGMARDLPYCDAVEAAIAALARPRDWPAPKPTTFGVHRRVGNRSGKHMKDTMPLTESEQSKLERFYATFFPEGVPDDDAAVERVLADVGADEGKE